MNRNDPKFKEIVESMHNAMKLSIQDIVQTDPDVDQSSRFRTTAVALSGVSINDYSYKDSVVELYDDALQMISVDLKEGYGNLKAVSMEQFDHQARDWITQKVEQLYIGNHPYCTPLKENPEYTAVFFFGFGAIPGSTGNSIALLPTAYCQLVDYTGDDHVIGRIIHIETWQLQRDGIFINPDMLKQFGRDDPEADE